MLPAPFDDIKTPAVLADAAPAVLADYIVAVTAAVTAADLEAPSDAAPAVLVDTAAVAAAAAGVTTNSSGSWSKMEYALEDLVHSKCANGIFIVCSICNDYHPNNVKGQMSAGVIQMRNPFWNSYLYQ